MIGSFLTRGLVMLFAYAYPAYECYKTVELNKPEIEQLRFWCQYWILVAVLTVGERFCDAFISWVPMYSEAKLAFIVYLWYPKTKGTSYVYDSFFRPYMAKHETEIDRNLLELRTRAGDIAILYWQRAASYGQTRIYEILQYVAAQSTPKRRPAQPQPQGTTIHQQVPPTQPPATTQMESNIPSSSSSIPSSNQQKNSSVEEVGPSSIPKPALSTASSSIEKAASSSIVKAACSSIEKAASSSIEKAASSSIVKAACSSIEKAASSIIEKATSSSIEKAAVGSETTSQSAPTSKVEPQQNEPVAPTTEENAHPPPKETVMEETIRATRGRLRKNRSIGK